MIAERRKKKQNPAAATLCSYIYGHHTQPFIFLDTLSCRSLLVAHKNCKKTIKTVVHIETFRCSSASSRKSKIKNYEQSKNKLNKFNVQYNKQIYDHLLLASSSSVLRSAFAKMPLCQRQRWQRNKTKTNKNRNNRTTHKLTIKNRNVNETKVHGNHVRHGFWSRLIADGTYIAAPNDERKPLFSCDDVFGRPKMSHTTKAIFA